MFNKKRGNKLGFKSGGEGSDRHYGPGSDDFRILFVSDIGGSLRKLNVLAKQKRVQAIVHTGNFGFFDGDSADSMSREDLAAAANASEVVEGSDFDKMDELHLRESVGSQLSELPLFLAEAEKLSVAVYTIWGEVEDIAVVEKFRNGTYNVPNLHIIDETHAPLIEGTNLRLLGLPGHFKQSWLFDIGDGTTVPGRAGLCWTGAWQISGLMKTFQETYSADELRVFVSYSKPSSKPLLNYLSMQTASILNASPSGQKDGFLFNDRVVSGKIEKFQKSLGQAQFRFSKFWNQISSEVLRLTEQAPETREAVKTAISILLKKSEDSGIVEAAFEKKLNISVGSAGSPVLAVAAKKGTVHIKELRHSLAQHEDYGVSLFSTSSHSNSHSKHEKSESPENDGGSSSTKTTPSAPAASLGAESEEESSRATPEKENAEQHLTTTADEKALAREAAKKEKLKKAKEKKKLKKAPEQQQVAKPGLWFKNGDRSPEEILGFLAEEDRQANPRVEFNSIIKPNGGKSKVALIFFDTQEQASGAYERVDKDAAGTVSIYQPEQHRPPRKSFPKPRKL